MLSIKYRKLFLIVDRILILFVGGLIAYHPKIWAMTNPEDFISPTLSETLTYDDNLYKISSPTILGKNTQMSDFINRVSGNLNLHNTFLERQELNVNLQLANNSYIANQGLNNISSMDNATLKWFVTNKWFGNTGIDFSRSLAGFANTQFFSADILSSPSYYFDSNYQLNSNWRFNGGIRISQTLHSAISRQNQNTDTKLVHGGFTFLTSRGNSINSDYSLMSAHLPNNKSNSFQEQIEKMVLNYKYSQKLNLEAQVGYKIRNYDYSPIRNFQSEIWRITAIYIPTNKIFLALSGWSEPNSFVELESNYYVSQGISIAPTWNITPKITLSGQLKMEFQDHIGKGTTTSITPLHKDELYSAMLDTSYNISSFTKLSLNYQLNQRNSTLLSYRYIDNSLMATVQFKF